MAKTDGAQDSPQSVEELQALLAEANGKIVALSPDPAAKPKPYTAAEKKALEKDGHVIGAPNQKLSTGHDESDLQKWDMWQCELKLSEPHASELYKADMTFPLSLIPMKQVKKGLSGNDAVFQGINKGIDFRARGANEQIFFYFPAASVEAAKSYDAGYWIEVLNAGRQGQTKHDRICISGVPKMTGCAESIKGTAGEKWS